MYREVIASADMFGTAMALSKDLFENFLEYPPLQLLTYSLSLLEVIFKGPRTWKDRTMFDIAAARDAFQDHIISDIGFVHSDNILADGPTSQISQIDLSRSVLFWSYLRHH